MANYPGALDSAASLFTVMAFAKQRVWAAEPAKARAGDAAERLAGSGWSSGISSSKKMDQAEAAGRAIEVGSRTPESSRKA